MDVDAVNSLSSGKGKGSSSPRDGCFKCGGAHSQRDCNACKNTGWQRQTEQVMVQECGQRLRVKRTREKSTGTKGAKGSHKGNTSKTGLSGLENSKTEASSDSGICTDMSH